MPEVNGPQAVITIHKKMGIDISPQTAGRIWDILKNNEKDQILALYTSQPLDDDVSSCPHPELPDLQNKWIPAHNIPKNVDGTSSARNVRVRFYDGTLGYAWYHDGKGMGWMIFKDNVNPEDVKRFEYGVGNETYSFPNVKKVIEWIDLD